MAPRLEDEYTEIAKATSIERSVVKRVLYAFWYKAKIDRMPEVIELLREARKAKFLSPDWQARADEILALYPEKRYPGAESHRSAYHE